MEVTIMEKLLASLSDIRQSIDRNDFGENPSFRN